MVEQPAAGDPLADGIAEPVGAGEVVEDDRAAWDGSLPAMFSVLSSCPPLGSQHSRRGCQTRAVSQVPASLRNTKVLDVDSLITMLSPQGCRGSVICTR